MLLFSSVIFIVDTGSPDSCICTEAMQALLGKNRKIEIPYILTVDINRKKFIRLLSLSSNKHYKDVDILGMEF
jgi:hypothetical protein